MTDSARVSPVGVGSRTSNRLPFPGLLRRRMVDPRATSRPVKNDTKEEATKPVPTPTSLVGRTLEGPLRGLSGHTHPLDPLRPGTTAAVLVNAPTTCSAPPSGMAMDALTARFTRPDELVWISVDLWKIGLDPAPDLDVRLGGAKIPHRRAPLYDSVQTDLLSRRRPLRANSIKLT